MIRIVVCGALGRMGKLCVERINSADDLELAAQVDVAGDGETVLTSLDLFSGTADLVIDFSFHTATPAVMTWAVAHNTGVIMCTTGQSEEEKTAITAAAEQIPVFWSANMSLGIALLIELAKKTAAAFPEADIEIIETHHNRKVDAPSGTAKTLQEAIGEERLPIADVESIREGEVPGIHTVVWDSEVDTISISHSAKSRKGFALGAVIAAEWMKGKTGWHDFSEIIMSNE